MIASLVSACAAATSYASRSLDIRSDGDEVLGCLPHDADEIVEVADAAVYPARLGGRDLPPAWEITLTAGNPPLRLNPGECLTYGKLPDGYDNASPPSEIQDEWPYEFVIRSPTWGRYRTRIHASDFCFRRLDGEAEVVKVPAGPSLTTVESCRELFDAANGSLGWGS
ncbi:hypothetical protein H0E84_14205 [Luteimonas sp. SJ-92]|uniref:Uncharacterized protein n=1 Tax=Luteimonas salinisoli TaxID=2752307 RepID=A0A853JFA9_9GAMM|nr:hypothetical protein [Luteimonas salinisoli]NZA27535.1 hypothetical protein [Luteimonas salinisoli]